MKHFEYKFFVNKLKLVMGIPALFRELARLTEKSCLFIFFVVAYIILLPNYVLKLKTNVQDIENSKCVLFPTLNAVL